MLRDPAGLIFGTWARLFGAFFKVKPDKLRPGTIAELPERPVKHALGVKPAENEVISDLRSMANAKIVVPDELPMEFLKLELNHNQIVLQGFYRVMKLVRHQRKVP